MKKMLGLKTVLRCLAILLTIQPRVEGMRNFRHQMALRSASHSLAYPSHPSNRSEQYSPWSSWTPCSRTCGTGIIMRSRSCLKRPLTSWPANIPVCHGDLVEHKICKLKECPGGSLDFRSFQCSQYNNRVIAGQLVSTWMTFEGGPNPCELRCEAKGQKKLVYGFGKVADGTSCSPNNSAICLDGRCLTVGCDEKPGSEVAVDMCGVCGGRNATCIHYKDVYLSQPAAEAQGKGLRTQYQEIVVIPVGARNLEIIHPIGRNILAMQDRNNGIIFNGMDALSANGGKYYIAGTPVHYTRENNTTEILRAGGPTTLDLYVLVLLRVRNPGIRYQYWLPKDQNHLQRSYLFSTSPTPLIPVPHQHGPPLMNNSDYTTPSPIHQISAGVVKPVTSPYSTRAPAFRYGFTSPRPTYPHSKFTNDYPSHKTTTAIHFEDLDPLSKRHIPTSKNSQDEKITTISSTASFHRTTPHPKHVPYQVPIQKPKYKTPKPVMGYYQMFRKEVESVDDPLVLYSKILKSLPDDAQGDSGSVNGARWHQSLDKGSQAHHPNRTRHASEGKSALRQSGVPASGKGHLRNPPKNADLNSRWAYKWGKNGEESVEENANRGRYAPTPVTIAVLPLPETYSHNTTKSENVKRREGKKHSKSRLTRGGLCGPCQKVRDQTKHFCHSDFVIRASIVDYEFLHGETRYEMQILQSFKNTLSLLSREYIWAPDTCKCPKLRVGREYVLMGRSDNSYRKNESRLLVDKTCFVRSYNPKYGRRLLRLRKDQLRKCRKVS